MSAGPWTLVDALRERARTDPRGMAFRTLVAGGAPEDDRWSWERWARASASVAAFLRRQGIGRGSRVAILAGAHPMWPVADLGIQGAGCVSVGLYPTSPPAQVVEVLGDCRAAALFVDSSEQYAKALEALPSLPELRVLVRPADVAAGQAPGLVRQLTWSEVLHRTELDAPGNGALASPDPQADAVLIYTSGSTGAPKGARLTHRTLVASARSIQETLNLQPGDRSLSFLPYCHAAERVFGLATRLVVGMEAGLVPDTTRVFEAAAAFRPTVFGGLPRFYEKIHEAAMAERESGGAPEEAVRRLTGGAVRVATSGGAALPVEVATSLASWGLTVLGAYGLTEHLCAVFNRPGDPHFDSAGPAMPGTDIRIADDGEILLRRSELTFAGYHGRPEETAAAFTGDGEWLLTGDLGALDEAGRLYVTGRKKELIALSTGKKVAPLRIEAWLVEQPWIGQAALVGEGRKYLSALLTLRRPVVEAWAREAGDPEPWPRLVRDARVRSRVGEQVDAVNQRLSRTESVRRFAILPEPFTAESGELTPTLKLRRDVIIERHAGLIEALYAEAAS